MSDMYLRAFKTAELSKQFPGVPTQFVWLGPANDLHLDTNNDIEMVQGTSKLAQDIIKILFTERGSNLLTPLYGSLLAGLIGQKMDIQFLSAQVFNEVRDSLLILQAINQDNTNLDEQVATLTSLSVDISTPYQINVAMVVTTVAGNQVGISFPITT